MHRFPQIILLLVCLATTALADVPGTISYQGRLTDNGVPVNGAKSVTFKIYDRSANSIWNSGIVNVTFTEGLFTVELGQSPQPPLFVEGWSVDTAMSLGVTIAPNRELSQRLHFKTVPYAMHALTAESANSGSGWLHNNGLLSLEDPNDSIGIGTINPQAKVAIEALGNQTALRINSSCADLSPALELRSEITTGAILRVGPTSEVPAVPLPAIYCVSNAGNASAGIFRSDNTDWPALMAEADGVGSAIRAAAYDYCLDAWFGKGIRAAADSATAIRAESNCGNGLATVFSSVYTGTLMTDHIAVSGYSRPADWYGFGGVFEGGYVGVDGKVNATGTHAYYGIRGLADGGSSYSCMKVGVHGVATGSGKNYGVYGGASGGTTDWAGYFDGDINVTGNIVKAASTFAIDHPTDPENEFFQQAEVVSDNLSAVYSGNVTLGSDGSAIVQLPDWLESFCGDFRYQLTCVGGYAPVYVSSEITGNQFTIAGGKAGLKVSWQITGIRKDKYAQANPLEVEKKKTASEQGKYLHPELFGYGSERSLSPNPDRDPLLKAKNDAVRAAASALTKPSTPPKQPQLLKK